MKRLILVVILALLLSGLLLVGGCKQTEEESPLQGWSLEEKIGQMFLIGFDGTALTPEVEELFNTIHPGGVILFARNIEDEEQTRKLIQDLQNLSQNDTGMPLFVATDQEGGEVVRITWLDDEDPESKVENADQAYQIGLNRARGLKGSGINLNLAPVLDLGEEGDFLTKYDRTFQGSPEEIGQLGKSMISGQADGGIFSTAKHFPGYGGIDFDPENDQVPVVSDVPEISQFQTASEANPEFIMTANMIYLQIDEDMPFTLSPKGIGFLKDQVKGDYLIISDDLATKTLKEKYSLQTTVTSAAKAGVDVLLISAHQAGDSLDAFNALSQAVKNGEISEEEINDRVLKVLRLKQEIS
jgi:beta-N-acetylhexosaminidase